MNSDLTTKMNYLLKLQYHAGSQNQEAILLHARTTALSCFVSDNFQSLKKKSIKNLHMTANLKLFLFFKCTYLL